MKVASASLPNNCYYCHCVFDGDRTIDHIVPKARNGTNSYRNLIHCCSACNKLKDSMTLEGFLKKVLRMPWPDNRKSKMIYKIQLLIQYRNKNIKHMMYAATSSPSRQSVR